MVTVQRSRNRGLPPPRPAWLKELENGRKLYIRLGASPLKLKSALTSYNVFEKAVAYWRSAMNADTDVDFPHVLLGMMKTGMYYPSAAWTFGKKMDLIHASTLFDLCRNSDTAIMEDVLTVFFPDYIGIYSNTCGGTSAEPMTRGQREASEVEAAWLAASRARRNPVQPAAVGPEVVAPGTDEAAGGQLRVPEAPAVSDCAVASGGSADAPPLDPTLVVGDVQPLTMVIESEHDALQMLQPAAQLASRSAVEVLPAAEIAAGAEGMPDLAGLHSPAGSDLQGASWNKPAVPGERAAAFAMRLAPLFQNGGSHPSGYGDAADGYDPKYDDPRATPRTAAILRSSMMERTAVDRLTSATRVTESRNTALTAAAGRLQVQNAAMVGYCLKNSHENGTGLVDFSDDDAASSPPSSADIQPQTLSQNLVYDSPDPLWMYDTSDNMWGW